jgi:integrase
MARRARGEGSVYLRGSTWWVKVYVNGVARPESSGSTKRSDAVKLLNKRKAELATGRYCPDADEVTFEDLAGIIEADYALQGRRSLKRLQLSLRHLREHFGDDRAVRITADRLTVYANARRAEGAALASISAEVAALRRAFNLAVRAGRLTARPMFPTLRLSNRREGFFEEADFQAVLAELPAHLKPLMTCGYLTGWRTRDELSSMTWAQVDLDVGTIRIDRSKNDEGRVFPINADPELAGVFKRQREYTDEVQKRTGQIIPLVFHNEGRPIVNYYKAWHAACRRAAVMKDPKGKPVQRDGKAVIARPHLLGRIPHDFRRSACRRLIQGGVPEQIAMKLTGWKSRQMLDRYFVFNERDLSEAVSKIATLRTAAPAEPRNVTIRAEA